MTWMKRGKVFARVLRRDSSFYIGVVTITFFGLLVRIPTLSHGSLFRDDAWVALTSRVSLGTAWRMVGTAPGFTLFERWWVGLTAPSTYLAQLPTLLISTLAIALIALIVRWWGFSRHAALLAAIVMAVGRTNINYATHLKPYAHDLVAAALILATAEAFRRGKSLWPFAVISLICFATSFTIAPLLAGVTVVLVLHARYTQRTHELLTPGLLLMSGAATLYATCARGISPALRTAWSANYISLSSPSAFLHSFSSITQSLIAGLADTTPHLHVPGYSKLVVGLVLVAVIVSVWKDRQGAALPLAALASSFMCAALHLAPLGTGRTDAYLYPGLLLLLSGSFDRGVIWAQGRHRYGSVVSVSLVAVLLFLPLVDRATTTGHYPGGSIDPVVSAARGVTSTAGAVLIEGTARWPWTYYRESHVKIFWSQRYNTGFSTSSAERNIYVMPGTIIEGGYDAHAAVRRLDKYDKILYVQSDDWPSMGRPLASSFQRACYLRTTTTHVPGFVMEVWARPALNHCPRAN